MESKFRKGDKVFIPKVNTYATVIDNEDISIVWNEPSLHLRSDDGFDFFCLESNCTHPDPTTAFLTELQHLLRKWNARIDAWHTDKTKLSIDIGDVENTTSLEYINRGSGAFTSITPDNIFDYDKD